MTRAGWLDGCYRGIDRLLVPLWYGVHWPVTLSQHMAHHWISHQHLAEENARLNAEREVLWARFQSLTSSIKENNQLRDLLSSSDRVRGSFITADLLAVLHRSEGQVWVLNRGRDSGVYVGQPVLDASGVVGQIEAVGAHSSRLLLVTDARVHVPVQNESGQVKATLVGDGGRLMKLLYVPAKNALKEGDVLVASGLGLQFPRGYPVGRIEHIDANPDRTFSDVVVRPLATLSLDRVLLLVWSDLTPAEKEAKRWLSGVSV